MRFSIAAIVALAAGAFAHSHSSAASPTEAYTTEVVTSYTTFCPEATTLTFSGTTYVVSTVRSDFSQSYVINPNRPIQFDQQIWSVG